MSNESGKLFNPCVAVPDLDTLAHQAVRSALTAAGNNADCLLVDATAGRGYDTLFLAQCALKMNVRQSTECNTFQGTHNGAISQEIRTEESSGAGQSYGTRHVVAFDVQQSSLDQVRQRLAEAGISSCIKKWISCNSSSYQVHLLNIGHEHLESALCSLITEQSLPDRVLAVMFNLGFLPGSDKRIVTRPETTLAALQGMSHMLCPHGIATVHCYSGHTGGQEECEAVLDFAEKLPWKEWRVLSMCQLNKLRNKEYLVMMERL